MYFVAVFHSIPDILLATSVSDPLLLTPKLHVRCFLADAEILRRLMNFTSVPIPLLCRLT